MGTKVNKPQATEAEMRSAMPSIDKFEVYHNKMLVGVYMKGTSKTLGNGTTLYIPDSAADEDRWQGCCGVVLKKGPLAFQDDGITQFGNDVNEGDWVVFRVSDGFSIDVEGIHCRMLEDSHIQARISDPSLVY